MFIFLNVAVARVLLLHTKNLLVLEWVYLIASIVYHRSNQNYKTKIKKKKKNKIKKKMKKKIN